MAKATLTEVGKRISVMPQKTEGILGYDIDNAYPQRVENIINSSGTGKLVTKMLAKFIFGGGFVDKIFYKSKVNKKGLKADKLLRKVALSLATFEGGVALHFNYNLNFQKIEVNFIPFKHCRLTTDDNKEHPGMIAVYEDWGREKNKQIDRKKIDYIDFYNPDPEVIQKQVEEAGGWGSYKGQILYLSQEHLEYPLATGDAVLEDMQTDSKAKIFKYRGITTNFMASHILEVDQFEETDENTTSESGKEEFMEVLQDFQGSEEALKILLLERKVGSMPFDLKKVEIQDVDKLYQYTEDSVRDNIIRHYLIPPILLMAVPGKMGTANEIDVAYQIYNANTNDYRIIVEELFKEAFDNFYIDLNPSKDFSVIPITAQMREPIAKDFFPDTTKNERRISINLPEEEGLGVNTTTLAEKIGVGGVTAFTSILVDPILNEEQKIQSLMVIFGVTKEEATRAVKGTEVVI